MAATAVPTSAASTPPTPPGTLPAFTRISSASLLQRNASTSSSLSTTTTESTSSLVAVPIRPPPIQTRTAATPDAQLPSPENCHRHGWDSQEPSSSIYGGRGLMRNGPRIARQSTMPPPCIVTSSPDSHIHVPQRSPSLPPNATVSPTTPRAHRLPLPADILPAPVATSPGQLRVTIALDDEPLGNSSPHRTRPGSIPSSPTAYRAGNKPRTLSVDASSSPNGRSLSAERERRQSQVSNNSTSSAQRKPSLRDYVLGDELGRGSYSTVVRATLAVNSSTLSTPRSTRQFAIKIMNQAHLVQENKIKYAHIERDALIRLSMPRQSSSPTTRSGHRRGMSSSSSAGAGLTNANHTKRKSTASLASSSGGQGRRRDSGPLAAPNFGSSNVSRERPTISIEGSSSTSSSPHSPTLSAGRRLSRGSEQKEKEIFYEREEGDIRPTGFTSRPPSPVKEESSHDGHSSPNFDNDPANTSEYLNPPSAHGSPSNETVILGSENQKGRTPRNRRQSLVPSERSVKSGSQGVGHPGIIRLYCTFADKTSVYYVLDLASNGELAEVIRKYGSLDLDSARFYAAQLIDTIEFMHDRDVIHRDLKPENILLDGDMRIKVTDFGSAKILGRKDDDSAGTSKRSFVGSADYVSPEVLRSDPATTASDIWAFGVVLFDLIVGRSPFRSATEYLTFQKVLQRQIFFPDGFDLQARSLIELVLDLNPANRPSPREIKMHPFFKTVDWSTLWIIPPSPLHTGLSPPVKTLAQVDLNSDVWAVFDDEVSDGGFEYDDPDEVASHHLREPRYDHLAAANAVEAVDHPGVHFPSRQQTPGMFDSADDLDPPRRAWLGPAADNLGPMPAWQRKTRGWSTSSSSSGRLSGLLETMGINTSFASPALRGSSGRASRTSDRSEDRFRLEEGLRGSPSDSRAQSPEVMTGSPLVPGGADHFKWSPLLLANERIVFSTAILSRPPTVVPLPTFLLPAPKRRQLILTDFPRLITVKEEPHEIGGLKVKSECVFLTRPSAMSGASAVTGSLSSDRDGSQIDGAEAINLTHLSAGGANCVTEVQQKGSKAFVIQTVSQSFTYVADTPDIRAAWIQALKRVMS